ncbi:hypothetical protein ES703_46812 [subsurface metagenome]
MKRICLVVLALALLAVGGCTPPSPAEEKPPAETVTPTPRQITKSGSITRDETWSGTIQVTGDIWLDDGATLTILPGTTVLMAAGRDDQNRGAEWILDESIKEKLGPICTLAYDKSHIDITGRIIAVGTPDEMIVFTSDSTEPSYADWAGILLRPGSRIEYCVVEYGGRMGIGVRSNIPQDESVLISNNIVRHIFMGGISSQGTACPRIISNDISDCGSEGIAVDPGAAPYIAYNTVKNSTTGIATAPGSSATIENNILIDNIIGIESRAKDTIRHNHISSPARQIHEQSYMGHTWPYLMLPPPIRFTGIQVSMQCSATIEFNVIVDNDMGIAVVPTASPSLRIENNNIYDNDVNNITNPTVADISAQNNWWGTTDIDEIEAKIHHYNDDPSVGKVNYQPIATAKIADAGPQD